MRLLGVLALLLTAALLRGSLAGAAGPSPSPNELGRVMILE